MLVSFLTLVIGNSGHQRHQYARWSTSTYRSRHPQLRRPSMNLADLRRVLGRPVEHGGYIASRPS